MWGYDWPTLIAATIVGIVGVARLTRLIVDDDWPPVAWVRSQYLMRAKGEWGVLVTCPFCVSPYFAAGSLAWAILTDLHWSWWLFHGWLAVAYAAALINVRDIPPESR
jgi:hypothetical protein